MQGLTENARQTLERWYDLLARDAMDELDPLIADEIVFRSPIAHSPYPGRAAIKLVLKTVNTVFENFVYHRRFASDDGQSAVLEFSATIGETALEGVDILRFDGEGRIMEFEVMVRPMTGAQALAAAMGARLGSQVQALKGGLKDAS